MSEFYESPYPEIRNQLFSIEDFLHFYMNDKGEIDYFSFWDAYNIPGESITSFVINFEFQMTKSEVKLLTEVLSHINDDQPYYLISALKNKVEDFEHELSHAKYKLDTTYKEKVDSIIEKIPKKLYNEFKSNLIKIGYADDDVIIVDEINAYLSTSPKKYIKCNFVSDDGIFKYRKKLKKLFKDIKKDIQINTIF